MKYKLRKALLFGLLLFAIAIPHHAQNTTDLDKVIDVATNYLQYSESDNKSNLENALAQATAVNRASASAVLAAYTNLSEAIQRYVLVAQPTGGKAFDMTFKMSNPELTQSNKIGRASCRERVYVLV